MSFQRELDSAREAALEAAALVRSCFGKQPRVEYKEGGEPVTDVDRAVNELIVRRIRANFPDDAILSEESTDDGVRFERSRIWMIDPIDGTSDFIAGRTGFAVMIGLVIDGRPRLGVVSVPATDETYVGLVGEAAWKETRAGTRVALVPSTLSAAPGIRLVTSHSVRREEIDPLRRALQIDDAVRIGSVGVRVGLVADARRDLYVYPGQRAKIWDTCAPEAILHAAGGRLSDIFGRPISYSSPEVQNVSGIVASNGPLHDRVLAVLSDLRAR